MNSKGLKNKAPESADKRIIYAAALQDHYRKQLGFDLPKIKAKSTEPTLLRPQASLKITKRRIINVLDKKTNNTKGNPISNLDGQFLERYEKLQKLNEEQVKVDHEKRIENYNKGLSLAQRLGLVEKPPKPITYEDWKDIESQAERREDDCESCPICLEGFKVPNSQVILSCSHTFHKACLNSFERHSRIRACPICRRKDYEKKNFDKGFVAFMKKGVIKIQKCARGYIIRRKFWGDLITSGYQAKSKLFKRRLLGYKLERLGKRWDENQKKKKIVTEQVLSEANKNTGANNQLMEAITNLEIMRRQNKDNINEIIPQIMALATDHSGLVVKKNPDMPQIDWNKIVSTAKGRCDHDCAICFNKLEGKKKLTILSCSHIFHASCINAFEFYDPFKVHTCPICRQKYHRADIENLPE